MDDSWKEEVSTPALVIDYNIMQKNIETMLKFTTENKVNY
jgi:D-serine deaminase-like pyridoxal phosphate-dependent protein